MPINQKEFYTKCVINLYDIYAAYVVITLENENAHKSAASLAFGIRKRMEIYNNVSN